MLETLLRFAKKKPKLTAKIAIATSPIGMAYYGASAGSAITSRISKKSRKESARALKPFKKIKKGAESMIERLIKEL